MLGGAEKEGCFPRLPEANGRDRRHFDARRPERSGSGCARAGSVLAFAGARHQVRGSSRDHSEGEPERGHQGEGAFRPFAAQRRTRWPDSARLRVERIRERGSARESNLLAWAEFIATERGISARAVWKAEERRSE